MTTETDRPAGRLDKRSTRAMLATATAVLLVVATGACSATTSHYEDAQPFAFIACADFERAIAGANATPAQQSSRAEVEKGIASAATSAHLAAAKDSAVFGALDADLAKLAEALSAGDDPGTLQGIKQVQVDCQQPSLNP